MGALMPKPEVPKPPTPKSYSKMPKEDTLVDGLIVIKKIPRSFDVYDVVFGVLEVVGENGRVEVNHSCYLDEAGESKWRIETKSERFLSEFKRQVAKSSGTKMPYEVEIVPSHKEVLRRINTRDWKSDYLGHVGRKREYDFSIKEFALIQADWLQRWAAIEGLVGWALRKLKCQKRCRFCGKVLTTPYIKCPVPCEIPLHVCADLSACESRELRLREDWESRRAEGITP